MCIEVLHYNMYTCMHTSCTILVLYIPRIGKNLLIFHSFMLIVTVLPIIPACLHNSALYYSNIMLMENDNDKTQL